MEKQRWEESERRRKEVRRSERRKSEKKENAGARKGWKVTIGYVFLMICGSRGSKSNLAKRQVRRHLAKWDMKNVQNTPTSDHFWKLRCRKSARRCGAKHVSKKNVQNTLGSEWFGPLLKVAMSIKCTPLWREAYFQVKMFKLPHARTIFGRPDVEKVYAVVAQSTFPTENVQNTYFQLLPRDPANTIVDPTMGLKYKKPCKLYWLLTWF